MTASGTATPIPAFPPVERPVEDEGDEVSVGGADVLVLVLVVLLPANPDMVRDTVATSVLNMVVAPRVSDASALV
jgi:hypothetical protein